MPIIERLCRRLGLVVIDPQSDFQQFEEADADRWTQRWNAKNQGLARYLAQRPGLQILRPYLSVSRSLETWRFCYERKQYEERLGAAAAVPSIQFAIDAERHVQRVVAWRNPAGSGISQLFPPCDYVALVASEKMPVKYVRTTQVLDSLKEVLTDTGDAIGNLPMLQLSLLDEASRAFDRLYSAGAGDQLTQIEPDAFVDCEA
jgi:hypothetical protein